LDARVTVHCVALSSEETSVDFELSDSNLGDHRVRTRGVAPGDDAFGEAQRLTITVPAKRLDDYLGSGGVNASPSTLIYVDVQGHEGHVLTGAHDTLARSPAVALEYWPYALARVGGRDRLLRCLANFRSLIDVTGEPRAVTVEYLSTVSAESVLELLAIGPYRDGSGRTPDA
jgi:FkbM family methyltransferase